MNWLQRHWDARAATNFILGGSGSGLLVVSVLVSLRNPSLVLASLVLIAAGLGAVWLEIGRKLRAVHVFFNPFTSWMSRESFAAALVFLLGAGYLFSMQDLLLYLLALAAAAFLYCQARLVQAAKGIPAWRAKEVVPLMVLIGLAEGSALALAFYPGKLVAGLFVLAVLGRLIAWQRYRRAVDSPALESVHGVMIWAGSVAALALLAASALLSWLAPLAGAVALAAGWWFKLTLITRASFNQGFSLPHLPVRGAR